MMNDLSAAMEEHYSRQGIRETILQGLQRKGIDLQRVAAADLYPYDQLHAGGIVTTRMLAERAKIPPHARVVDIGCGIGGAARFLHTELSCRVLGIELTAESLQTASELNRLIGVASEIDLIAAQADCLPLGSGTADVVWTQHLTMNLPDHARFLRECARVLKPFGRLACHEWFLKSSGPLPFPLPWAPTPSLNHAIAASDFLALLRDQNFLAVAEDVTAAMLSPLQADIQGLMKHDPSSQRIPRLKNLVQSARDGLIGCWMITATAVAS